MSLMFVVAGGLLSVIVGLIGMAVFREMDRITKLIMEKEEERHRKVQEWLKLERQEFQKRRGERYAIQK